MAVQKIKFKRGTKAALTANLTVEKGNVLALGEPAFETDTGQLKIGDGVKSYAYLDYVGAGESGGTTDSRFVIQDPEANQVLLYDTETGKWVNKDLADAESIVYLNERGLTIQGYDSASAGQMLIKTTDADGNNSVSWITPLSEKTLQDYTDQAASSANLAGTYATNAGNSATEASTAASTANRINQQTMNFVNNKFWWGTVDEYNALESISADTFYFIKAAD